MQNEKQKAAERIVDERLAGVNMPKCYRYLLVDCVLAGWNERDKLGDKASFKRGFIAGKAVQRFEAIRKRDKHPKEGGPRK